jgi:excisionase family DNA binding protein
MTHDVQVDPTTTTTATGAIVTTTNDSMTRLTQLRAVLDELLTLNEAAEMIGVSYDVISRLAREGKLPVYEVVGVRKVHPDDLITLVKVPVRG